MKRFGLVGKKISYSLSPLIHNAHFESLGINAYYELIDIDVLSKHLDVLRTYDGFNITVPYKESFLTYLDELSDEVKVIEAVNCVVVVNGKFKGYNTDIYGIYKTLSQHNLQLGRKKVLIIGAGGAGKAVYYVLKNNTSHDIYVTNRTSAKATELTKQVVDFTEFSKFSDEFDIIINCVTPEVPIDLTNIKPNTTIIDINYQKHNINIPTSIRDQVKIIDGYAMLIYQAARSFELWFNLAPNVDAMYLALERRSKNAY